jgi:hypothetical protein
MAVDDRHLDVHDILTKVTVGWITPPTEPEIILEDRDHSRAYYETHARTNGTILIHQEYSYEREKHSVEYETRVWAFPITIYNESSILLQGTFDQAREVFDRYTVTPHATGTLGTGTTYSYAGIEKGEQQKFPFVYALNCTVYLREQFVAVKIA